PQTPPPATSGAAKGKGKAAGKKSNTAPQQQPSQPDPAHDFDDEIPF
ncbi:single-stranded DNA-binding protein, partial [Klebsiella pneumoniae]